MPTQKRDRADDDELAKLKSVMEAHQKAFQSQTTKALESMKKALDGLHDGMAAAAKDEETRLDQIAVHMRALKKKTKELDAKQAKVATDALAHANAECERLTKDALQALNTAVSQVAEA